MKSEVVAPVSTAEDLVPEAAAFVYTLFKEKLPEGILFHTYQHTVDVAEAAAKIGKNEDLSEAAYNEVLLAAWFHDTGYVETYDGHEEVSVRIAEAFLRERGLPPEEVARVANLIRVTQPGRSPETLPEKVLRDADIAHLGRKKFFERSERLRLEWAQQGKGAYSDQEWAEVQHDFLTSARYETDFARRNYGPRKDKNVKALRRHLAELLDAPKPVPQIDKETPSRGIETMFRTAYRNHINLSSIADSKANIMISINAILMSIIVSYVSVELQTNPWLMVPAASVLLTSLAAIVFAILSARPKVTSRVFTLDDVRRDRANILFFGNFVNMPLGDFREGMRELMGDADLLYDNMISDLYALGEVLQKKYLLLWISYTVFMGGLVLSVVLYLVFFFRAG